MSWRYRCGRGFVAFVGRSRRFVDRRYSTSKFGIESSMLCEVPLGQSYKPRPDFQLPVCIALSICHSGQKATRSGLEA
jgi:hypothetical protein